MPCTTELCLETGNCTQRLPQVKLDPTTRAGASCVGVVRRDLLIDEILLFVNQLSPPSE